MEHGTLFSDTNVMTAESPNRDHKVNSNCRYGHSTMNAYPVSVPPFRRF